MSRAATKYLVDSRGRKKAVLLDMAEYARLVSCLEELEDALDLEDAVRTAQVFRELAVVREELKREGRLGATASSSRSARKRSSVTYHQWP